VRKHEHLSLKYFIFAFGYGFPEEFMKLSNQWSLFNVDILRLLWRHAYVLTLGSQNSNLSYSRLVFNGTFTFSMPW